MRVIAGEYRGKKLFAPADDTVRPTGDRIKESLFQILSMRLVGARVLDLFCGSGALGIECLSRGAEEVIFNDASKESVALTQKNLRAIGRRCAVSNGDYLACLARAAGQFDLIFADPPYKENYCAEILNAVKARSLLKKGGLVIYESEREEVATEGFERCDLRSYGRTKVAFFRALPAEGI